MAKSRTPSASSPSTESVSLEIDRTTPGACSVTTLVNFRKLTNEEIDYYVSNFKPYDKAGSYGIQEWMGYVGIKKMEGDFFNVMGLPLHKTYREIDTLLI